MKYAAFGFVFVFLVAVFLPGLASGQGLVPCGGEGQPACGFCHIFQLINNVITFFLFPASINNGFALVPLLAAAFILVGGFFLVIGGSNPGLFTKGKNILLAVVIGTVIVYGAWVFLSTFMTALGVAEWTGLRGWWQIQCSTEGAFATEASESPSPGPSEEELEEEEAPRVVGECSSVGERDIVMSNDDGPVWCFDSGEETPSKAPADITGLTVKSGTAIVLFERPSFQDQKICFREGTYGMEGTYRFGDTDIQDDIRSVRTVAPGECPTPEVVFPPGGALTDRIILYEKKNYAGAKNSFPSGDEQNPASGFHVHSIYVKPGVDAVRVWNSEGDGKNICFRDSYAEFGDCRINEKFGPDDHWENNVGRVEIITNGECQRPQQTLDQDGDPTGSKDICGPLP